jgi:uncharacterized protein (DUF488 family)
MRVFTIGHSTRTLEELAELLRGHGVTHLVDIRTVPRSRNNPWFDAATMGAALAPYGIRYSHAKELGGLRHARKDSPNGAWENASFRGYADHMQTPAFEAALAALVAVAADEPVAIMCAEAVPWRCHRSLVADALTARGVEVLHIMGSGAPRPHHVTSFAHIDGEHVTYPPR